MLGSERHSQKPQFDSAFHTSSLFQPPSPHSKSVSSLTVKKKDSPLLCEGDETISIQYTFVGETAGTVDLMYLVSSDWRLLKKNAHGQVCMLTVTLTLQKKGQIPNSEIIFTYFWNSPRLCQEGKSSFKESKMWRF